jgi:hypothetical protein
VKDNIKEAHYELKMTMETVPNVKASEFNFMELDFIHVQLLTV